MREAFILLALGSLTGACTTPNPRSCSVDNHCSDPAFPFCDIDGAVSTQAGTCIPVDCTPGDVQTCRGDEAIVCNPRGDNFDVVPCENGCDPVSGCQACREGSLDCEPRIVPLFIGTQCEAIATTEEVRFDATATFDTSVDTNCGEIIEQTNGLSICLVRAQRIFVDGAATLSVTGSRALALVADSDLLIEGKIDASAVGSANGPGGGLKFSGTAAADISGGGGAGFATAGAGGGSETTTGAGGSGGQAEPNPLLGTELVGGTRPSRARQSAPAAGGAGGNVTLVACRGNAQVTGYIDVSGGGGSGGSTDGVHKYSGAGGGSGGFILIQGREVTITGGLYANGGAGGGGMSSAGVAGTKGNDGSPTTSPASGGNPATGGGRGGNGGASDPPGGGAPPMTAGANAGGGGGSAGFIQLLLPRDQLPQLTGAVASPPMQPTRVVEVLEP